MSLESMSSKIKHSHLARLAVFYLRGALPSSGPVSAGSGVPRQAAVLHARAQALGWEDRNIRIIEQDSGLSGATTADRPGYKALVADVRAGNVGAVFVRDSTRLTRSIDEWIAFAHACAGANTLIITEDEIFDPSIAQDRLLLGLKDIVVNLGGKHRRKR